MRKNLVKEKLKAGETVIGVFCNVNSPPVVEVLGLLGFDFVIIDSEHGPMDLESCEHMVRAAESVGTVPIIRVALNLQQLILRNLDMGAMGVQMPLINTKAEAQAVVNSVKYPPVGKRGLAPVRANDFGITEPLGEYVKKANEETLIITHIETMEAVKNLPEILTVEGIDVVFLGPTDLSSSMGYPGQTSHPEVLAVIEKAAGQIRDVGKAAGTIVSDLDDCKRFSDWGIQYMASGALYFLTKSARKYIQELRQYQRSVGGG